MTAGNQTSGRALAATRHERHLIEVTCSCADECSQATSASGEQAGQGRVPTTPAAKQTGHPSTAAGRIGRVLGLWGEAVVRRIRALQGSVLRDVVHLGKSHQRPCLMHPQQGANLRADTVSARVDVDYHWRKVT